MRAIFGLVGLLVALAVVALVAKKQLAAVTAPVPALQTAVPGLAVSPASSVRQQSQQIQQQYQQALDAAMRPPPMPEDAK